MCLSSCRQIVVCVRRRRRGGGEAEDIKDSFRMYTGFMLFIIILVSFKDQSERFKVLIDSGRDNINISCKFQHRRHKCLFIT